MQAGLKRLLRPESIAVIGGHWARAVITSSREVGFDGAIWPVHPDHDEVEGIPAFRDVASLPAPPDAVFIGVNRHETIGIVQELAEMKAGGVVAFAAGFAESDDGEDLQKQLIEAAGDMPVMGPNCYGVINYLDGALLWPDVHGGKRVARGVALIAQSSNLAINLTMQNNGLPIAFVAALGNQAMVRMADMIRSFAGDERVTAIGLHIEGIPDAHDFADAVNAAKRAGKPVIALMVGASEGARRTTLTHTASLAGTQEVAAAFFASLGVGQAHGVEAFLQALGIVHCNGGLSGKKLVTISCSGGEASLMADAALRQGVAMPEFTDKAKTAIARTVNPMVTVSNPFDYHTFDWGNEDKLTKTFTAVLAVTVRDYDYSVLIIDFPAEHIGRDDGWYIALRALQKARDKTGAQVAVLASMPENMRQSVAEDMMAADIPPLRGFDTACEAMLAAHGADGEGDFLPRGCATPQGEIRTLTEHESKTMLAKYGVPVPRGQNANTPDDALAFARDILANSGKVVMKTTTAAHKTESGGVILGIANEKEIATAFKQLGGAVLIEEMITDTVAEIIIGIARDPCFGLHMVLGAGGIETEIREDSTTIMLPASRARIESALNSLRVATLLQGFRGRASGDTAALLDCCEAIAAFALEHEAALVECDMNPVLVRPKGVAVVDALISKSKTHEGE